MTVLLALRSAAWLSWYWSNAWDLCLRRVSSSLGNTAILCVGLGLECGSSCRGRVYRSAAIGGRVLCEVLKAYPWAGPGAGIDLGLELLRAGTG